MNASNYHMSLGKVNPRPILALLATLALILTALSGPGHAWGELRAPRPAQPSTLLINEVQYDPAPTGTDHDWEWLELYNPTDAAVPLLRSQTSIAP